MKKFVVVVGGVISGVGKGVTTASLGKIIKSYGYKTTVIKIDPYINFDAGTLRPTEHGEVWVTHDGGEIDQDLGTYERFLGQTIPKKNNITTGQIYQAVINRERAGEYLGKTVQFIPHIPEEIMRRIDDAAQDYEVVIIEIGGTVGDYENKPFLFTVKALEREYGKNSVAYVLVAYLPIPHHLHEMKTKPVQQAIKLLNEEGISPDFIICRSRDAIDHVRKKKIETYAHIAPDHVIAAPDIETIYQIPLDLEQENIGKKLLCSLDLTPRRIPDWQRWQTLVAHIKNPTEKIRVGIVGKYIDIGEYTLTDSYLSIDQALVHAGAACDTKVQIQWLDAKELEQNNNIAETLAQFDGIIIPGGFGDSGVEGKMAAIEYVRTNNIPYLGLCYGMQLAAIEYARNVCKLKGAHTTEVDANTPHPIVTMLPRQTALLEKNKYGGTMRLGAYDAQLVQESKVHQLYTAARRINDKSSVAERHRHRYEMNPKYVEQLQKKGMFFPGYHLREDGTQLMEYLELPNHSFFVATQSHPEFTSQLGNPNPLFSGFVKACKQK